MPTELIQLPLTASCIGDTRGIYAVHKKPDAYQASGRDIHRNGLFIAGV